MKRIYPHGRRLISNFLLLIKSLFFKIEYRRLDLPVSIPVAIIILASVGLFRNIASVLLGVRYGHTVWFVLEPSVLFTMAVFPFFLCFFPAMFVDYFAQLWKVKVSTRNILGIFFYMQFIQVVIPFFDKLQTMYRIPYYVQIVSMDTWVKLALSPLALTPLILVITNFSSLGIDVAWLFVTFVLLSYGVRNRFPIVRYVLLIAGVFYIVFVMAYPGNYLFFRYENLFFCGLYYLVGALGGLIYFKSKHVR